MNPPVDEPPRLDDALWAQIAPILPPPAPRDHRFAGRRPTPDRRILDGIVFVTVRGLSWNELPSGRGLGSGTSCWQRLRAWEAQGLWPRIRDTLAAGWRARGRPDLAQAFETHLQRRAALNRQIARSRNAAFDGAIRLVIGFDGGISERVARLLQETVGQRLQTRIELASAAAWQEQQTEDTAASRSLTLVLGGAWLASRVRPPLAGAGGLPSLVPIAPLLSAPFAFVVPAGCEHADWRSLAWQAARGGRAPRCATPSAGTRAHLYLAQVEAATGIGFRRVPCGGGGPQVRALLEGSADCAVMSLVTAMPLLREGRLRALAFSSQGRLSCAPEIPSMAELGHPALHARTWLGLYGIDGIAARLASRLAVETTLAFKSPAASTFMHSLGASHPGGGGARLERLLDAESRLLHTLSRQPAAAGHP